MARFTFETPAWLAASGGRRARVMIWLRDRLAVRGVTAVGPLAGDFGAGLMVNAEDGFVSIRLGPRGDVGRRLTVIVERTGEADAEYEDTLAACEDALACARLEWDLSA
jgi:hypothetical protein